MIKQQNVNANGEEFSRDLSLLSRQVCWVLFRFPDSSVKIIRTTLNDDILEGIQIEEDSLFDLDSKRWFKLSRVAGSMIEIYEEMPKLREVDLFANQFII